MKLSLIQNSNRFDAATHEAGTPRYFPSLTGLRAIAAFMVYFHHYGIPVSLTLGSAAVVGIVREMHTGVSVFYVLSGFLIYYRYAKRASVSWSFYRDYLVNRLARIYPMYFLVVALGSIYALTQGKTAGIVLRDFILQVTFIRGFSDLYKFIGVAQGWSLTVEEVFYFVFPVAMLASRRLGMLTALFGTYLIGGALLSVGTAINFQGFFVGIRFVALYTFFGRAAEFFVGMFVAKAFMSGKIRPPLQRVPALTICGCLGMLGSLYGLSCLVGPGYSLGVFSPGGMVINNLIVPVCVGVFISGLLVERSWIRAFLASRLMELLGKSSYVFYLIHLGVFYELTSRLISQNYWVLFTLINVYAVLMYLFIEHPANNWIKRVCASQASRSDREARLCVLNGVEAVQKQDSRTESQAIGSC
ncbi:MAG: acyltransferase [Deltaproteobacteria bacterium]|nr:acyltransferase [Deltaproteobacteria bacterium]